MAQNHGKDLLDRLPDLDLLVGTQKFHRVPDHLDHLIASRRGLGPKPATLVDLEAEEGSQNTIRDHDSEGFQPTAFVSIMQGCNMHCAFCIVPKTRGPERCRSIADIVAECRELAARGTREVTLLGQIVNSYGRRELPFRDGISPFVQLLEAVSEVAGIERIRFTSPHPRGFKDDLVEAYARLPKLMPCVHLPMQSGSDRILRAMNRPYSAERYQRIVDALRGVNPDMNFSTDIIVGFPGETDADFDDTRKLVERNRFDMAFIFKYSVRTGTAAEPLGDPVPDAVKEERNQVLLDIVGASSLARHQSLVGTVQQVLLEGPAKRGENMFVGRNPGQRKILCPASPRLVGQIVPVRIESATVATVMGRLELAGVDEPALATALHA
jgi:tRNA-2-methylthio-N6-dimethylallyladenosine synthase